MRLVALAILICMLLPVGYSIQITEIMYDAEGKDTGFEWIEIYNDEITLDICSYKLYEAETNHYIKGDYCEFESATYLILADKPENFNFDCTVLDSAFSLKNSGEEICIRDAEKNNLDCITYSSDLGASGNGESLQLINGAWQSANPTPGYENTFTEIVEKTIQQKKTAETEIETEDSVVQKIVLEDPKLIELENKISEIQKELERAEEEKQEEKITSHVVYESKAQESNNIPVILLLTVSISLNVILIISKIRK
jgi:hypothetical protein